MNSSSPQGQQRGTLPRAATVAAGLVLVVAVAMLVLWLAARSDGSEREPASAPLQVPASTSARSSQPTSSGSAHVAEPAPSQVDAERPRLLQLPSGTTMQVDAAATAADGELAIPTDINHAGWWDGSSRLGDPFGSVVVAAHIDSFTQGLGRFVELLEVEPGDLIVASSAGLTQEFRVVSAKLVSKSELSEASAIYAPTGDPRLVLITCGGAYDADRGGYQDNMVVEAVPAAAIERR